MTRSNGSGARERGAAIVEFALVVPFLVVLVMGIVDFGTNMSNQISLHQGAREASRQATVANFGPTADCGATLAVQGSANMRKLVCLAKARSDTISGDVSVAIRFDPSSGSYPAPGANGPVGNGILVCTTTPLASLTGMFGPLFEGRYLRSTTVMRIERASGVAESESREVDPSGDDWSWCAP